MRPPGPRPLAALATIPALVSVFALVAGPASAALVPRTILAEEFGFST